MTSTQTAPEQTPSSSQQPSDSQPSSGPSDAAAVASKDETASSSTAADEGAAANSSARSSPRGGKRSGGRGEKRQARGPRNRQGRSGGRDRNRRVDNSPPRFDVSDLAAIAGPPLWQAVHNAKVADITDVAIFVDVAADGHEALRAAVDPKEFGQAVPEKGQKMRVRLLDPPKAKEDEAPVPAASWRQAMSLDLLDDVIAKTSANERVEGIIASEVKGGYAVAIGSDSLDAPVTDPVLRGFLPRSQATLHRGGGEDIVGNFDAFSVTELEADRANIVLSRRAALRQAQKKNETAFWETVEEGQQLQARVRSLVAYGAFVDVGGVDALLHVSDLSWDRQPNVAGVLKVGQRLDVVAVKVDKAAKKLKVGVKQLSPDPWGGVGQALKKGDAVTGTVVALADFGAFIQLQGGVEGLIHQSEITWERTRHASQKLRIGQEVTAKVLDVDRKARRISLSTKALEANPFAVIAERFPAGTVLKVVVKDLADFGAFVGIDDSVDGMIHVGELSWTDHIGHPSEVLTIGQEVEVVVLRVDIAKQRVACSIKQLTSNPWEAWEKTFSRGSRHKLKVSRVTDGGVVFELDGGLSGFCPRRELSSEEVGRVQDFAKVGSEMEVEVKLFDKRSRRVTLSARAVLEGETRAAYDEYKKQEKKGGAGNITLGDALRGKLAAVKPAEEKPADDKPTSEQTTADAEPASQQEE